MCWLLVVCATLYLDCSVDLLRHMLGSWPFRFLSVPVSCGCRFKFHISSSCRCVWIVPSMSLYSGCCISRRFVFTAWGSSNVVLWWYAQALTSLFVDRLVGQDS